MTPATGSSPLYIDDFMTGLLAALAMRGVSTLSAKGQRLDRAFKAIEEKLLDLALEEHLDVHFRIETDFQGRAPIVHEAFLRAARRKLISRENPEFVRIVLNITQEDAPMRLQGVPGSPSLYDALAREFMRLYKQAA